MTSWGSFGRRRFLQGMGTVVPLGGTWVGSGVFSKAQAAGGGKAPREWKSDLVIVGGGLGGCAAALAAARRGLTVVMTEETDWIGGQLTSQAVPPDENRWVETHGATTSYQELRTRIRDYYKRNFPLTDQARAMEHLNPGNGSVSKLCHEPRVALAVLQEMLAPWVASGRLRILLEHVPMSVAVEGDRVKAVQVRSGESGHELWLAASYVVDATETGELLPLSKAEYVTGAEARADTGEPNAADEARPQNMQAFTCCFTMEYLHGQDHTIEKPEDWDFWKDYVPELSPAWPGRLLDWFYSHPHTLKPNDYGFDPVKGTGLFRYRRIVDHRNFLPGTYGGDVTLVNWPQNDYMLGNPFECSPEEAARHVKGGKQLSLSLLYWMQTAAPRLDGGTGWPGLKLRPDMVGTEDGLAKYPYIRESRRIKAQFTVCEQHVGTDARAALLGLPTDQVKAGTFADSVGIGSYRIDLHPSTRGINYIDVPSLPFQIPLGALIPQRVENLLPACKNLGVTHITNGCYRLHPVEWNIGESVGELVAFCVARQETPRGVANQASLLSDYQKQLRSAGVRLEWEEA